MDRLLIFLGSSLGGGWVARSAADPVPSNRARQSARVLEVRIQSPPADSQSLSGFRLRSWKGPGFPPVSGLAEAAWSAETRAAERCRGDNGIVSVGLYFSTAVLLMRVNDSGGTDSQARSFADARADDLALQLRKGQQHIEAQPPHRTSSC
jgi:hypothetical protein